MSQWQINTRDIRVASMSGARMFLNKKLETTFWLMFLLLRALSDENKKRIREWTKEKGNFFIVWCAHSLTHASTHTHLRTHAYTSIDGATYNLSSIRHIKYFSFLQTLHTFVVFLFIYLFFFCLIVKVSNILLSCRFVEQIWSIRRFPKTRKCLWYSTKPTTSSPTRLNANSCVATDLSNYLSTELFLHFLLSGGFSDCFPSLCTVKTVVFFVLQFLTFTLPLFFS